MTPSRRAAETANKRAERLRRKEAGEVRVEAWIGPESATTLDQLKALSEEPLAAIIESALFHLRRAYP